MKRSVVNLSKNQLIASMSRLKKAVKRQNWITPSTYRSRGNPREFDLERKLVTSKLLAFPSSALTFTLILVEISRSRLSNPETLLFIT